MNMQRIGLMSRQRRRRRLSIKFMMWFKSIPQLCGDLSRMSIVFWKFNSWSIRPIWPIGRSKEILLEGRRWKEPRMMVPWAAK